MVNAVMLSWQNYMPILKLLYPQRQAEVCVRPLVDLVGKGDKHCQGKQKTVYFVQCFYSILVQCEISVSHVR